MAESRFCAYCDQPAKPVTKGDREWGRATEAGGDWFVHVGTSEQGIPNCGRRLLSENQTYTESSNAGSSFN